MNVKNLLIEAINDKYNYPIILQGSMSENQKYDDSFFTFWNNDTINGDFYDNRETTTTWDFDLNFYSTDPLLVDSVLLDVIELLKNKKFIIDGKGYDVMSDEVNHTGRGVNVLYIEKEGGIK